MGNMKKTNLFYYATSELSQDAFICWLLSHCLKECAEENPLITKCALEVLRQIPGLENITYIDEIRKQYKHIDVLIIIGNIHVIVEDKTFTQQHENQINRYVNSLVESGINKADIKTVYYKIEEQPWPENVNCEFTRRKLLSIYRKYRNIDNPIFQDYVEYLEDIDQKIEAWEDVESEDWDYWKYLGLYKYLRDELLIKEFRNGRKFTDDLEKEEWIIEKLKRLAGLKELSPGILSQWNSWGYVNNPKGGFMGFYFSWREWGEISEYVKYIYLQLENHAEIVNGEEKRVNELCLRVEIKEDIHNGGDTKYKARKFCKMLRDYFVNATPEFNKHKKLRIRKTTAVGYFTYDKNNIFDKIELMENILKKAKEERPWEN